MRKLPRTFNVETDIKNLFEAKPELTHIQALVYIQNKWGVAESTARKYLPRFRFLEILKAITEDNKFKELSNLF